MWSAGRCGTVSPAGIDRYSVLWRHRAPCSPCPQQHGTQMNISVSCEQQQSQNYCQRNQLPKVWTKISHAMVPKQTGFQHWVYIASKYMQTIFLKISVQVYFSREVKSSLTTQLRTQQRFCLPIVLGSSGAWFLPWAIAASLIPAETQFKIPFLSREVLSAPPSLVPKTPVTDDVAHFFPVVTGEVPGSVFSLFRFRFTSHKQAEKMWKRPEPLFSLILQIALFLQFRKTSMEY